MQQNCPKQGPHCTWHHQLRYINLPLPVELGMTADLLAALDFCRLSAVQLYLCAQNPESKQDSVQYLTDE